MEKLIAGKTVNVNDEGYLTDFSQWTKEVGTELAKEANVELTPRHWEVLSYLQKEHQQEVALSIRSLLSILTIHSLSHICSFLMIHLSRNILL